MRSFVRSHVIAALSIALIFAAMRGRTASAMDATTLLNQMVDALGGAANIEKIHTMYFKWNAVSMQFENPASPVHMHVHQVGEEWLTSDGNDRVETHSAAMQAPPVVEVLATGSPPQGWMLAGDQGVPSGNTTAQTAQLSGPDLSREISHVYWTTFAYSAAKGRLPGTVTYKPTPGSPDYLLEMDPQGGEPIRASISAKTFLPGKITIGNGTSKMVVTFGNWKSVDGVKFPFHMTISLDEEQMKLNYTFTKVALNIPVSGNLFKQLVPAI